MVFELHSMEDVRLSSKVFVAMYWERAFTVLSFSTVNVIVGVSCPFCVIVISYGISYPSLLNGLLRNRLHSCPSDCATRFSFLMHHSLTWIVPKNGSLCVVVLRKYLHCLHPIPPFRVSIISPTPRSPGPIRDGHWANRGRGSADRRPPMIPRRPFWRKFGSNRRSYRHLP